MTVSISACPRCGAEFDPGPWSRKFCSRSCANSRTFSEDARQRKSLALQGRPRNPDYDIDRWRSKVSKKWNSKWQDLPWEDLPRSRQKQKIFDQQNHCCGSCGIKEWQGQPVVLKLAYRDRDSGNFTAENLVGLCGNCVDHHRRIGFKDTG